MAADPARRILVTGASGFVGPWLMERLASDLPAGSEVLAVGQPTQGASLAVDLDITQGDEVEALVARFRPTCVIHLAGISSVEQARCESRRTWEVNVFGTLNLAEAVLRHAPEARFVFASSSEVYGASFNDAGGTIDEAGLLQPRNAYAMTKAAADLALGQMAEAGLRAVRLRLFNHTGPGQSTRFVVPAFAAQIADAERGRRPPTLKVGNLEARRDFLDVRDVVAAYLRVVTAADLPPGIVINVSSGTPRRIGDILEALLRQSRVAIRIEPDEALMRPSDVPVTAGDARRAHSLLDWRPAVPWETTLRDVLDACRRAGGP